MLARLLAAAALGLVACAAPSGSTLDEEGAAAEAQTSAPVRHHLFVVRTKGFIAPITNFGGLGDPVSDAALSAFGVVTNHQFSEDPQDGNRETGQYRLWAQVLLDVTCTGTKVDLTLTGADSDAGYEGPLKAAVDPIRTKATKDGKFWFQASGRPHPAAEPAFQAVYPRTRSTIWYEVAGRVTCDANADASLKTSPVVTTAFPSFRLWTQKHSGGGIPPEVRVVDRPQGPFSELWDLPPIPPAPTTL